MTADFAQRFPKEHAAFSRSIVGVPVTEQPDCASTVLHRLMFLYFLQANGWLDSDPGYLRRYLKNGGSAYHCRFLQPFLRDGLSKSRADRQRDWGQVPFLGGGVFEDDPADFDIADAAFRRLFAFFDEYRWSFDSTNSLVRSTIHPQTLGTLFEKHANRKETGTYYTPPDVTGYIARNTILPVLLDAVCPAGSPVWELLRRQPESYIPPVRNAPLPLPSESEIENRDRLRRCRQLRKLLALGKITSANDLVTHNLDIRRFVLDAITVGDRKLAGAFLAALDKIRILDPTCGSGAFLLAALDLLEEIGSVCLQRIGAADKPRPSGSGRQRAAIIQRNLYGVDLRGDAVELCRLRLLLRLLSASAPGNEWELPNLGTNLRTGNILTGLPDAILAGGFDVVIGNPPYIAADQAASHCPSWQFVTADCPDVYAWVLERSAGLVRDGGRTGMIVPLSLAFSEHFASCRRLLFATYGENWFSSFARIPSALFAGDIRVRNTIHLGHKSSEPGRQHTTRLHRWFDVARPQLFPNLTYTAFRPECWGGRIPRLNSPKLMELIERCLQSGGRLGHCLSRQPTPYRLYFKKTAYNWLTFCRRLPPCYAGDGSPITQTQFDVLHFSDARLRDLAFLLLNGKWTFAFWCALGDDFHVTRWMVTDLPADLTSLPNAAVRRLLPLAGTLEKAMDQAVSFKRNAGKRVGTYNLARCRKATDRSDRIFADSFGWSDAWDDVELLIRQVVKTEQEE